MRRGGVCGRNCRATVGTHWKSNGRDCTVILLGGRAFYVFQGAQEIVFLILPAKSAGAKQVLTFLCGQLRARRGGARCSKVQEKKGTKSSGERKGKLSSVDKAETRQSGARVREDSDLCFSCLPRLCVSKYIYTRVHALVAGCLRKSKRNTINGH